MIRATNFRDKFGLTDNQKPEISGSKPASASKPSQNIIGATIFPTFCGMRYIPDQQQLGVFISPDDGSGVCILLLTS